MYLYGRPRGSPDSTASSLPYLSCWNPIAKSETVEITRGLEHYIQPCRAALPWETLSASALESQAVERRQRPSLSRPEFRSKWSCFFGREPSRDGVTHEGTTTDEGVKVESPKRIMMDEERNAFAFIIRYNLVRIIKKNIHFDYCLCKV
jgi:hypothetical protein